ncbi:hypothetical protein PSHT_03553 [Puccinia striiformis]|uniref:Helicase C-terminal domain-containing protein n=1 Tax=Puccinia striiformis TaxID=27350 RepID=A0A2S4WF56_9BASI|nr:hypothetical protein PSHT_03553 [Puccinia striiformis]
MSIVENNSSSPPSSSLSPLSSPPNETTTTSATPTPAATAATAAATNSILINQRNRFGSRQQSLALTQAALRRQAEQKDVHRPLPVTSPYAHLSIPSTPSSLTIQNNPHHHHHHHHHPNQPSNRSQQSPWAFRPSTPTTPLTQSPSTKPDKPAPICIGLLSSLVLILYRLEDFEIDHSPTGEHFGVVEHKIGNVLGPLLGPVHSISGGSPVGGWSPNGAKTNGLGGPRLTQPIPAPNQSDGRQLFIECCVIRRGEQNPMMLPLQLLVFCLPDSIPSVATYLSQSGVSLEHPVSYHPEMHLGCLYDNPHSAQPREAMESIRQRLLGNSAAAHPNSQIIRPSLQACDTHHRVATIFKSLASGVDLDETEPGDMIVTSLYPHQKQALSFMLDRETPKTVPADLKTARNSAERKVLEKEDDENLVSLWKKTRDTYGRHVGWMNVVTGIQQVGKQTPPQCRGAILADDMGLGKTISIISLITATHQAAIEFAQSPIIKPTTQVVNHPSRNNNKSAKRPHSETLLDGTAPKKEGAIAAKKRLAVHDRSHLIKLKSRATLIVCPLSTVQNWESQIEEHVRKIPASTTAGSSTSSSTPKSSLSVCVYHGNTRTSDVNVLADYDVVITTYSLLGYEFSRQNRSTKEAEEGNDSSDGVEEVDADGGSISNAQITNGTSEKNTQVKNNGKLKRKRKGDGLTSPLQAIEWFRVVLDEAHMIKEHTTTQSKAACDLLAERRVCLTGTPLQNSLNDLFSLVCFLRLEPFTDRAVWTTHIGTPARLGEPLGVSRLQLIMRHIALRRTKQTSDKHGKPILTLPPKKDDIVYLELNEAEKEFYSMYHQRSRVIAVTTNCAHVGLVLDSEARSGRELDLARQIEQEGFSRSKAIHLLILMRDTGATQCSECGREAISASTADNEEDVEDLKAPLSTGSKRCRKKPNNLKQQQQQHSNHLVPTTTPTVKRRSRFPDGRKEEVVDCSVCLQQLSVSTEVAEISAAELQNNIRLEELRNDGVGGVTSEPAPNGVPKARSRKSKVATQKMKAIEPPEPLPVVIKADVKLEPDSKPSAKSFSSLIQEKGSSPLLKHGTKITQLLLDLLPFSQANPASFNFAPQDPMFNQDYNPNDPDADFKPTKGAVVKSVVFSQWTKLLDKIASALDEFNIQYKKLDGTMNRAERNRSMDALKADPKCEVLLVSLRAGGVGLNLTCAQRVYLMEPFWNPAVENQAVDRVHRLGQTKPVRMIRYIISGSVEQNMLEIQKRKTELANMSLGQTLSKEELAKRRVEDLHILFKENI